MKYRTLGRTGIKASPYCLGAMMFGAVGPEERAKSQNYQAIFQFNEMGLKRLHGTSEYLVSYNTYQFNDYSKYDAPMFDERAKTKYKAEHFPTECQTAFAIGAKLARQAGK